MRWLLTLLGFLLPAVVAPVDIYPAQPQGIKIEWAAEQPSDMPTVTKTVAASGADYTTVAAALAWFTSNHDFDTDGIARILITDASTYTFATKDSLSGISGTPDIDGHLEVTSDAANPFAGPLINFTHTSGDGGWEVDMAWIYIHNLRLYLNTSSSSAECLRIMADADNVLISRNVFIALNDTQYQDGIYAGGWDVADVRIDNNVFIGFGRAAIHLQGYTGGANHTADMDFNTIGMGTRSGESAGGGIMLGAGGGCTVDVDAHNNLVFDYRGNEDSSEDYHEGGSGANTYIGSNNIAEDASAESRFTSSYDSVNFTESEPGSGENAWLTEIDDATETNLDLSIAGENAYTVTGNGVDRTGSEPDARQDFSIDIMGNARHATTPDIGAFEFSAGGTSIPAMLMINGQIKQYTDESPNSPLCLETDGSIKAYSDVTGKNPLVIEDGAKRVLAAGETLLH